MPKFDNPHDMLELFYDEFKTFRSENRENYRKLEDVISTQNTILNTHSEQLIKLVHTVHGNGTKGLVDRINAIEENQKAFASKFTDIETREKIRAAILGVTCAVCSSVGGIIAYVVSIYTSLHK